MARRGGRLQPRSRPLSASTLSPERSDSSSCVSAARRRSRLSSPANGAEMASGVAALSDLVADTITGGIRTDRVARLTWWIERGNPERGSTGSGRERLGPGAARRLPGSPIQKPVITGFLLR